MSHDLDRDKVVKLVIQALNFRIGEVLIVGALILNLFSELVASMFGKFKGLFGVDESLIILVEEGIPICQVKIGFC